jgi:hypothetical protein
VVREEGERRGEGGEVRVEDKRVVAYVVGAEAAGVSPGVAQLRAYVSERLPSYMVPQVFVVLDELPLTANGKVDRRALPAPEQSRPELGVGYVAPRTEAERSIAAIWQELLHLDEVGVNDNFFDLGGHSLLLAQVHSRLQQMYKPDLALIDLFRYPTLYTLAKNLEGEADKQSTDQQEDELAETLNQGKSRLQRRLERSRQSTPIL